MKHKTARAEIVAEHLSQIPPEKMNEFFAHWELMDEYQNQGQKLILQSGLLSGLLGILGAVVGQYLIQLVK